MCKNGNSVEAGGKAAGSSPCNRGRVADWQLVMPSLCAWLLFAAGAFYVLVPLNSDVLFAAQEHNVLPVGSAFRDECIAVPCGFLQWAGCKLTQYFYHPAIGASLLVGMWMLTAFLLRRAIRLPWRYAFLLLVPLVCLLCSEVNLGYHLYLMPQKGYWFFHTVAMLCVAGYMAFALFTPHPVWRLSFICCGALVGYPLFGVYALVAVLSVILVNCMQCRKRDRYSAKLCFNVGVPVVLVTPYLWYRFIFVTVPMSQAWTYGLPQFYDDGGLTWRVIMPFVVILVFLPVMAVASPLLRQHSEKAVTRKRSLVLVALVLAFVALAVQTVLSSNYWNGNYHRELSATRAADEQRWQDIIDEARSTQQPPTQHLSTLYALALLETGQTDSLWTVYNARRIQPLLREEVPVSIAHTGAAMLYYYYGLPNYATRWAVENSVKYGMTLGTVKMLLRAARLSGDVAAERKYRTMLAETPYHKDYAAAEAPAFTQHLYVCAVDLLELDGAQPEQFIVNYYARLGVMTNEGFMCSEAEMDSITVPSDVQHFLVTAAMLSKNPFLFWGQLGRYVRSNGLLAQSAGDSLTTTTAQPKAQRLPLSFQEAISVVQRVDPEKDSLLITLVDKAVVEKSTRLNEVLQQQQDNNDVSGLGQQLLGEFGKGYQWFYCFGRNTFMQ